MISFLKNLMISHIISLIPFSNNDDQIRLQMANSQMRQSLLTDGIEFPEVATGYENLQNYGTMNAKEYGIKVFSDDDIIVLKYKSRYDVFIRLNHWTFIDKDEYEAGDVVLCHDSLIDGKYIQYGMNARVAFMPFFGFNIEDAIVVSESFAKRAGATKYGTLKFIIPYNYTPVTLDPKSYKPLPDRGDIISKGDNIVNMINTEKMASFFNSNKSVKAPDDIEIISTRIYPNKWSSGRWDNYVQSKIIENRNIIEENEDIKSILYDNLYYTEKFIGEFKYEGESFDGVLVEVKYKYKKALKLGDKLANRHGNKGVISKIVPDKDMPHYKGEPLEILFNPLGAISRMNVGQIYELYASKIVSYVKNETDDKEEIFDIIRKIYEGSDYENIYDEYIRKYSDLDVSELKDKFTIYIPPFSGVLSYKKLEKLLNDLYDGFKFEESVEYGSRHIENIAVGKLYIMRLHHIAEDKMKSTYSESVTYKHKQPKNGQKIGEMEFWALAAWCNDEYNIREIDFKSDNIDEKRQMLSNIMTSGKCSIHDIKPSQRHVYKMLHQMLKVYGVEL